MRIHTWLSRAYKIYYNIFLDQMLMFMVMHSLGGGVICII